MTLRLISGSKKSTSQSRSLRREPMMSSPGNCINITTFAWVFKVSILSLKTIRVPWTPSREPSKYPGSRMKCSIRRMLSVKSRKIWWGRRKSPWKLRMSSGSIVRWSRICRVKEADYNSTTKILRQSTMNSRELLKRCIGSCQGSISRLSSSNWNGCGPISSSPQSLSTNRLSKITRMLFSLRRALNFRRS